MNSKDAPWASITAREIDEAETQVQLDATLREMFADANAKEYSSSQPLTTEELAGIDAAETADLDRRRTAATRVMYTAQRKEWNEMAEQRKKNLAKYEKEEADREWKRAIGKMRKALEEEQKRERREAFLWESRRRRGDPAIGLEPATNTGGRRPILGREHFIRKKC